MKIELMHLGDVCEIRHAARLVGADSAGNSRRSPFDPRGYAGRFTLVRSRSGHLRLAPFSAPLTCSGVEKS